jgi:hypothetical protein
MLHLPAELTKKQLSWSCLHASPGNDSKDAKKGMRKTGNETHHNPDAIPMSATGSKGTLRPQFLLACPVQHIDQLAIFRS